MWGGFAVGNPTLSPSTRESAWLKVPAILAVLRSGNDVFWMDSDSVFVNLRMPLPTQRLVSPVALLASPGQWYFINTGHLLLSRGEWSEGFLKRAWGVYPVPSPTSLWEQSAMQYVLAGELPECRASLNLNDLGDVNALCNASRTPEFLQLEQRAMNSYVYSTDAPESVQFHAGDLLIHFARPPLEALQSHSGRNYSRALLMALYHASALGRPAAIAGKSLTRLHRSVIEGQCDECLET